MGLNLAALSMVVPLVVGCSKASVQCGPGTELREGMCVIAASSAGVASSAVSVNLGPAAQVVVAYLKEPRCLDHAKYILFPETNTAAMAEWYKGQTCGGSAFHDIQDGCQKAGVGDWCWVTGLLGNEQKRLEYEVFRGDDGFKIDWRSSVKYNPMTLAAYQAQLPTDPVTFRVNGKLSDYFNYEFSDAKLTHYSIRLTDPNNQEIYGFVQRSTADGKRLFDLLKDGRDHEIMVSVAYLPTKQSSGVVQIMRLVNNSWRQTPDEGAASAKAAR